MNYLILTIAGIAMNLNDLTPEIKAKIKEIAAQHGALNVRVLNL